MKRVLFSVPFVLHLIVCVLFSFDLGVLEGDYLGFPLTFLCLFFLFFPFVLGTSSLLVWGWNVWKKRRNALDSVCALIGFFLLTGYAASALGLAKGVLFSVVTFVEALGTLLTAFLRVVQAIRKRRRMKK